MFFFTKFSLLEEEMTLRSYAIRGSRKHQRLLFINEREGSLANINAYSAPLTTVAVLLTKVIMLHYHTILITCNPKGAIGWSPKCSNKVFGT